jgi:hypothetical protein
LQDLDEICDEDCLRSQKSVTCKDGSLVIFDPVTDTSEPISIDSIDTQGSLDCSVEDSAVYSIGATNDGFEGQFGAGSVLDSDRRRLGSIMPTNLNTGVNLLKESRNNSHQLFNSKGDIYLHSRVLQSINDTKLSNPLVCVKQGDSIIFAVTNDNYPVYEKDSLMNTNLNYDYSSFRDLASKATSSLTVTAFSTTFEANGIYVYSMSSAPMQLLVIAVMPPNVNCSTDAQFVPFSRSNLITMGITSDDEIVLSPDWNLVLGLLAGMLLLVLILIGFLYFFRKRSWTSHRAIKANARLQNMMAKGDSTKGGFFSKKEKISDKRAKKGDPSKVYATDDDMDNLGHTLEDVEAAALANESHAIEFDDDMLVPELASHMQKNHDTIDRQMHIQKDILHELQESLKKEVDDIKAIVGTQGHPTDAVSKTAQSLEQAKVNLLSRTVFESNLQASNGRAIQALSRIQQLLDDGPLVVAGRIVDEIAEESSLSFEQGKNDSPAAHSSALDELVQELGDVKNFVDASLVPSLNEEERRRKQAESSFQQCMADNPSIATKSILESARHCSQIDTTIDTVSSEIVSALKALVTRIPKFVTAMSTTENALSEELNNALELGNPDLAEKSKEKTTEALSVYLQDLVQALAHLLTKLDERMVKLNGLLKSSDDCKSRFTAEIEESQTMLPAKAQDTIEEMLKKILENLQNGTTAGYIYPERVAADTEDDHDDEEFGVSTKGTAFVLSDEVDETQHQADESVDELEQKLDDNVLKRENISDSLKEELLEGIGTDTNMMHHIIVMEKERHEEALNHLLDSRTEDPEDNEDAIEEKHRKEQEGLAAKLQKDRVGRLNALLRAATSAQLLKDEDVNEDESRVMSLLSSRFAVLLRLHGLRTRREYADLHHKFNVLRFERAKTHSIAIQQRNKWHPETLMQDFNKGMKEIYHQERDALLELKHVTRDRRSKIEEDEEQLRAMWQGNVEGVDLQAEVSLLKSVVDNDIAEMQSRAQEASISAEMLAADVGDLHYSNVEARAVHFDKSTLDALMASCKKEVDLRRKEATSSSVTCLNTISSVNSQLQDILDMAFAWSQVDSKAQQKSLHERMIVALYSFNDAKNRLTLGENSLRAEAAEMKLFSDLNKIGASESEVARFIQDQHENEEIDNTLLKKRLTATNQQAIAKEKERQATCVVDYEKELARATELNAYREVEFSLDIDESRDAALHEVMSAMLSKKEFVLSKYRSKKLPQYVVETAAAQIDAEIQREECELNAAYISMSTSLCLSQQHASSMVEGLLPDTSIACTRLEMSFMTELNSTRESFGSEIVRKQSKKRVLAHAVRDAEANRLTLLGRPAEELQNLDERLNASLDLEMKNMMDMVASDWRRIEAQLKDNLKDKQGVQLEYGKATQVLSTNFLTQLDLLKRSFAEEKQRELKSDSEAGVLRLEQRTVARIAEAYVSYHNSLCEEFRKAVSHQNAIDTIEDDARDLRNRKQQENEAYENTFEELRLNKLEDLTGKQISRRNELDEKKNQYERDLIGLEEQLRLKKDLAHKFLQNRLSRARQVRENFLIGEGLSGAEANKVAASESKEYESNLLQKLNSTLDQQDEALRDDYFNRLQSRSADASRRRALLKECIPFGLHEFERREFAEFRKLLSDDMSVLMTSLAEDECGEEEIRVKVEQLQDVQKNQLKSLEASQKNIGPELIAYLKAEAEEDILRLRDISTISSEQREQDEYKVTSTRDSAIVALSVGLNIVMEKRESYTAFDADATVIQLRLENAIDHMHDDRITQLRYDYDKALNGLEDAFQVSKQSQKKNLLSRINKRKEQRRRELEQQGLNEKDAQNQVSSEFSNETQRITDLEAVLDQNMVDAISIQKKLVEENAAKFPSTALNSKEDMEASILLQKLMQDESNFLKTGGDDAYTTATAARNAAKSSLVENEARFTEMKAEYERDIDRIKEEFESLRRQEINQLKEATEQQLSDFVASDAASSDKQRLAALKQRNEEELQILENIMATDRRVRDKCLKARLAAQNLQTKYEADRAIAKTEGDQKKIDVIEKQVFDDVNALKSDVLTDLEIENTGELELCERLVRKAAEREAKEQLDGLEKQHAEEALTMRKKLDENEMDAEERQSFDEHFGEMSKRNAQELHNLMQEIEAHKELKVEQLQASLAEKASRRKDLAIASTSLLDNDEHNESKVDLLSQAMEQTIQEEKDAMLAAHVVAMQKLEALHLTEMKETGDNAVSVKEAELRRAEEKALFDRKKALEEKMKNMINQDYLKAHVESDKADEMMSKAQDRVAELKRQHDEELKKLKERVEVEKKAKIMSKSKSRSMGLQMLANGMLKSKQDTESVGDTEKAKHDMLESLKRAQLDAERSDLDESSKAAAMRRVAEIKRRNDEELKALEDGIVVDKKMKEKRLKARLAAKSLQKRQAEQLSKAIADATDASDEATKEQARNRLEELERRNIEEIQALQNQVLMDLEHENVEALQRNMVFVREAAEKEALIRVEEMEKRHADEALAQLLEMKQKGLDDAVLSAQVATMKQRNEEELKKLKDNLSAMKKAKEENLKARLAEKIMHNRQLALSNILSSDEDEDEEHDSVLSVSEKHDEESRLRQIRAEAQAEVDHKLEDMERVHAEAMAAAMLEARQLEMDAAAAAAREKVLDAERNMKERMEEELNSVELQRLKDELEREEEKNRNLLQAKHAEGKGRLEIRLAEKRARKERELQEHENRVLQQLAEKQASEKEEREKLRQAKMKWNERLNVASAQAEEMGLEVRAKEDYCFTETLGKKLVPESHLSEAAQIIMKARHSADMTQLLNHHYKERINSIKTAIEAVMEEKAEARIELVDNLVSRKSTDDFIKLQLTELDSKYAKKQADAEVAAVLLMERDHMKDQTDLRQQQLEEISSAISMYSDPESMLKLRELSGKSRTEEMAEYRANLQAEKDATENRLRVEREEKEERMRQDHQNSLEAIKQQLEDEERAEQAQLEEKRLALLRQKAEFEKKQADESGSLNLKEKARILETFEKEFDQANKALSYEKTRTKSLLQHRLEQKKAKKKEKEAVIKSRVEVDLNTIREGGGDGGSVGGESRHRARKLSGASLSNPQMMKTMDQIQAKLVEIDRVMQQLSVGKPSPAPDSAKLDRIISTLESSGLLNKLEPATLPISAAATFIDSHNPPQGDALISVADEKLSLQEKARIQFGRRLAEMVGIQQLDIAAASSLPPSQLSNNSFKNSYHYDTAANILHIHTSRLTSSGDFGLVAIHALSHIKINPVDLSNDSDPAFMNEFYTNLRILSQDLYKRTSSGDQRRLSGAGKSQTKPSHTTSGSNSGNSSEYFGAQSMQARMQKYVQEGGIPAEYLDRYNKDSNPPETEIVEIGGSKE